MNYLNNEKYELSQDLVSFGLNPKDWKLVQESGNSYRIESDEDHDFVFRGLAGKRKKKNCWKKIEIMSL